MSQKFFCEPERDIKKIKRSTLNIIITFLKSETFAKVVFNGETIDFTLLLLSTKGQFFCFSNSGVRKK